MTRSVFTDILGRTQGLDRPAILGPEVCDYRTLVADARRLAADFSRHVEPGDAVCISLPHGRAYITSLLAARQAELVVVPANPKATAREKSHVVLDSGARLLVTALSDEDISLAFASARIGEAGGVMLHGLKGGTRGTQVGDAAVIYTSGSTGEPKGAVLTESALSANISAVAGYLELVPSDSCALFTPPSYAYAISQIFTHLYAGGAVLPWPNGMLFPVQLLDAMRENGVTGVQANPTILEMLLAAAGDSLPSVRYVMSGGQPLFSSLVRRLKNLFPNARIVSMYGCTESSPRISYSWLPQPVPDRDGPWPVGRPVAGMEFRIENENGASAKANEVGEVVIRGTSLMRTYLHNPDLTAQRLRDGWFRTMDTGFIDTNGELVLVGRADNILIVGHEKVAPEEIEDVILQVQGVREAAVGGIADPMLVSIPVALVAADGEWTDTVAKIRAACSKALSRVKIPRHFVQVDSVPRTAYGKIDRRGVAAEIKRRESDLRISGEKTETRGA